jgi:FMN reductase
MSSHPLRLLGIGGTTRAGSTSERALRFALSHAQAQTGVVIEVLAGEALLLPLYDPAQAQNAAAQHLIEAVRRADGIVIASPCYHGTISGLIKNALDYVEALRTDARPYLEGRAVGCVVVADGPQAMGSTLTTMRAIVHALRGWPTPYAACVDAAQKPFGTDSSTPHTEAVAQSLKLVTGQVLEFARMRAAHLHTHPTGARA